VLIALAAQQLAEDFQDHPRLAEAYRAIALHSALGGDPD
jgi:hypothetical protein